MEIPQAFSYHEFLSFEDGSEDGDGEGLKGGDGDGDGDDDNDDLNLDSGEPTIVLTRVGFKDSLLYSTPPGRPAPRYASRPRTGCPNSIFRKDMWMDDPELHLMDSGMAFLSQLAQLCIQAKMRRCDNKDCVMSCQVAISQRTEAVLRAHALGKGRFRILHDDEALRGREEPPSPVSSLSRRIWADAN